MVRLLTRRHTDLQGMAILLTLTMARCWCSCWKIITSGRSELSLFLKTIATATYEMSRYQRQLSSGAATVGSSPMARDLEKTVSAGSTIASPPPHTPQLSNTPSMSLQVANPKHTDDPRRNLSRTELAARISTSRPSVSHTTQTQSAASRPRERHTSRISSSDQPSFESPSRKFKPPTNPRELAHPDLLKGPPTVQVVASTRKIGFDEPGRRGIYGTRDPPIPPESLRSRVPLKHASSSSHPLPPQEQSSSFAHSPVQSHGGVTRLRMTSLPPVSQPGRANSRARPIEHTRSLSASTATTEVLPQATRSGNSGPRQTANTSRRRSSEHSSRPPLTHWKRPYTNRDSALEQRRPDSPHPFHDHRDSSSRSIISPPSAHRID